MSSVGKGIVSSSIGRILQFEGVAVSAVKMDPYVNVDAGTMNPYQHGEVFVTQDGGETDLDLGHYERFLDVELKRTANITTGKVYLDVIEKERRGDYLGQTVQIIPHVVDEIKRLLRLNSEESRAKVQIVEVGGTVGDIESLPFLEAIRQLRLEEGYENTVFVHVSLVPTIGATGEVKTKPTQHSVQELRRIGVQPDVIIARSEKPIDDQARGKLSLFASVPKDAIFCSYDLDSIYQLPLKLRDQGFARYIVKRLHVDNMSYTGSKDSFRLWGVFVENVLSARKVVTIGMVGKYTSLQDAYLSITEALIHAGAAAGIKPKLVWIDSQQIDNGFDVGETNLDGLMVLPGFGGRGTEGKIRAVEVARKQGVPFLGICFGMQLSIVEFARHVLGLDANSTEIDARTANPVVDLLPEQSSVENKGGTMRLGGYPIYLQPGSMLRSFYGVNVINERHRHRYEVNPVYIDRLVAGGLKISGWSQEGNRVEAIELPDHPFFVAAQFHPEFKSRPMRPSPPYLEFVKAIARRRELAS